MHFLNSFSVFGKFSAINFLKMFLIACELLNVFFVCVCQRKSALCCSMIHLVAQRLISVILAVFTILLVVLLVLIRNNDVTVSKNVSSIFLIVVT